MHSMKPGFQRWLGFKHSKLWRTIHLRTWGGLLLLAAILIIIGIVALLMQMQLHARPTETGSLLQGNIPEGEDEDVGLQVRTGFGKIERMVKGGHRYSALEKEEWEQEKFPLSEERAGEGEDGSLHGKSLASILPEPSFVPVKKLEYFQLNKRGTWMAKVLGRKLTPGDLFSGALTWPHREESFKVRPSMKVHCGFSAENSGFDYDEEDRTFLGSCRLVVATCNFGGVDSLLQPLNISNFSMKNVCFVAFWDESTARILEAEDKLVVDQKTRRIGQWRIVVVSNLPFEEHSRNGKIPKMLAHRLFPNAQFSIWIDSKRQLKKDPVELWREVLWSDSTMLAIARHPERKCIYEEAGAVLLARKADPLAIGRQIAQYAEDGFPRRATLFNHSIMPEGSWILREHNPLTNLFMCLWFNEVVWFSPRDQLSFGYVLWKLQILNVSFVPTRPHTMLTQHKIRNKQGVEGHS